jgi:hypothetical protein
MQWDPDVSSNNQIYNNSYTSGGYAKSKLRKLLLVVGVILAIIIVLFIVHISQPESQQSKYTRAATLAARKQDPNAQATNVKVAGGFAIASVSDPSAQGQANAGYETIFKVNKDGSMAQIASGSSFGPLSLAELGIPLSTQAKLAGSNIGRVEQNLASQCGYGEDDGELGFSGFSGSFNPGGWQLDAATLSGLLKKLSSAISNQSASEKPGVAVICVNAAQKNSNFVTDQTTHVSTFTLQVQFITNKGTFTTHTITFTNGSIPQRTYTLDGSSI